MIVSSRWRNSTLWGARTHHTDRTEHEAEGDPGAGPALGEGIVAALVVEHVPTLQLHNTKIHTEIGEEELTGLIRAVTLRWAVGTGPFDEAQR